MKEPIKVWPFHDAPAELRALSGHGGDEDWLAVVPAYLSNSWIGWAEEGSTFGCSGVERHVQPDGSVVLIGAHA
jgi:hypothetical protein